MAFHLNASLDPGAVNAEFVSAGFAHVRNILPEENARRIYKGMLERTAWNLVFNDKGKHIDLSMAHLNALGSEKRLQLQNAIYAQAQSGFQYCYNDYPIFDAYKAGENEGHVLHKFYEWLNGDEFLEFARSATGFDDISFVDAQATQYRPGHFLTTHDDTQEGKNRRAAYIFNFTPNWSADWGGYLQLLDDDGDVRRGLRPTFNTLNILKIPQKHNVGIVAPFAGGMRMSVSGWLRHGDPE